MKKNENFLDFITIETVSEFYELLITTFTENFNDERNVLEHRPRQCDCAKWINNIFDRVSSLEVFIDSNNKKGVFNILKRRGLSAYLVIF